MNTNVIKILLLQKRLKDLGIYNEKWEPFFREAILTGRAKRLHSQLKSSGMFTQYRLASLKEKVLETAVPFQRAEPEQINGQISFARTLFGDPVGLNASSDLRMHGIISGPTGSAKTTVANVIFTGALDNGVPGLAFDTKGTDLGYLAEREGVLLFLLSKTPLSIFNAKRAASTAEIFSAVYYLQIARTTLQGDILELGQKKKHPSVLDFLHYVESKNRRSGSLEKRHSDQLIPRLRSLASNYRASSYSGPGITPATIGDRTAIFVNDIESQEDMSFLVFIIIKEFFDDLRSRQAG